MSTEAPDRNSDVVRTFPAKFSPEILDVMAREISARLISGTTILDPFAGVGGIHQLARHVGLESVGVEIEPEWAATHPQTVQGDSRFLPTVLPDLVGQIGVVATSPAYGNRMADQYLGSAAERCGTCKGSGWISEDPEAPDASEVGCPDCTPRGAVGGTGRRKSKRVGYAISLGRKCSPGSGAALAWGQRYRDLHLEVLRGCRQMSAPRALWLINVSSSIRAGEYVGVMEWWVEAVAQQAEIVALRAIPTRRMRLGQNAEARVPVEHLIVARCRE